MIAVLLSVLHAAMLASPVVASPELPAAARLSGIVVSEITGEPIPDARLHLVATGVEVRSEENGDFSFEAHEIASDTLVVSHPEHAVARLFLADLGPGEVFVRVRLRAVTPTDRLAPDPRLDALLQIDGVSVWDRADFETFGATVVHLLDFLAFSGLFEDVPGRSGGARCPQFTGAPDCARVWLNLAPVTVTEVGAVPRSTLRAFILVPPGVAAPPLGLTTRDHDGAVVVIAEGGTS